MPRAEIEQSLISFITEELLDDRDDVSLNAGDDLLTSQLVDSLGVIRIVAFLEKTYSLEIPPADVTIENFIDVTTIGRYLESRGV